MTKITIDDTQYEFEDLSDEAKNLLQSIQFLDNDITRLNAQIAAYQTARNTYGRALKEKLGVTEVEGDPTVDLPENISFD